MMSLTLLEFGMLASVVLAARNCGPAFSHFIDDGEGHDQPIEKAE
jgi:hypothetical protein